MELWLGCLIALWAYVCSLIVFRKLPLRTWSLQVTKGQRLQKRLDELNIPILVQRYQMIRVATIGGWGIASWMTADFRVTPMMAIPILLWMLSGTLGLSLIANVKRKFSNYDSKRDGQLIAFARLYELQQRTKKMQLSAFCRYAAEFLPMLRSDLLVFAQRLTTDGNTAFEWFEGRFPPHHLFLHRLLTTIRAMENGVEDRSFGHFIDSVAQDHYLRRKKAISPALNTLMSLPSALVILMVVVLLMQYISITKQTITLQ